MAGGTLWGSRYTGEEADRKAGRQERTLVGVGFEGGRSGVQLTPMKSEGTTRHPGEAAGCTRLEFREEAEGAGQESMTGWDVYKHEIRGGRQGSVCRQRLRGLTPGAL